MLLAELALLLIYLNSLSIISLFSLEQMHLHSYPFNSRKQNYSKNNETINIYLSPILLSFLISKLHIHFYSSVWKNIAQEWRAFDNRVLNERLRRAARVHS